MNVNRSNEFLFLSDCGRSINYALGVTPEAASQWETYFREHPEQIADAEEAKAVLLAPADATCDFSLVEKQNLKDRIVSSIKDFSNIL